MSGDCGGVAAAIVSARHPVYLLGKLANPRGPENPKYLPLVCPYVQPRRTHTLFTGTTGHSTWCERTVPSYLSIRRHRSLIAL